MTTARVLLVDDDRSHLLTTKELLEDEGYQVTVQLGPFGATERIMTTRPDLVLLDVNMPALSGEALLPLLKARQQTRDVPVVLHSSNDEDALRRSASRLGAAGYACKGDVRGLLRVMEQVLAARPAPAPAAAPAPAPATTPQRRRDP